MMKPEDYEGNAEGRSRWRTSTLIRRALEASNDDSYWACIGVLHERGTREVLDVARELLLSESVDRRALGAGVLGQLGYRTEEFAIERRDHLLQLVRTDPSPEVVASALHALSHARRSDDPTGTKAICLQAGHKCRNVRRGVVMALLGHDDRHAINTLIRLSSDAESDIRDWSTFGIGTQTDVDSPRLRAALRARANDEDADTRGEALVGLAKREDPGVETLLLAELGTGDPGTLVFEAVREYGHPRLLEPLEGLLRQCQLEQGISEYWLQELRETLEAVRCRSSRNGVRT